MTLKIELNPEEEARLQAVAARWGLEPAACAKQLLARQLPPLPAVNATASLFAEWESADGTDDPAEIEARTRDWESLKTDLECSRLSLPGQA